jgi:hypothetical protein
MKDKPIKLKKRVLNSAAKELYDACKEFVRKCECGEAHSVRSYAQMKRAIRKAEGDDA